MTADESQRKIDCLLGKFMCEECNSPSTAAIEELGKIIPVRTEHARAAFRRGLRIIWNFNHVAMKEITYWKFWEDDIARPAVSLTELVDIIEPDELVIPEEMIPIKFTYPRPINKSMDFYSPGGFSRGKLFTCICEGYKMVFNVAGVSSNNRKLYIKGSLYYSGLVILSVRG